jgi:hypothetical protein
LPGLPLLYQWLEKHIRKKFTAYQKARQYLPGYENAAIGFRFTKSEVNPDFRSAVEKEVNQLRAVNPNVNIIIEWK